MPHPDRERLTLVALGEQPVVDALSAHLDQCAQCRSEVTAMRDTVALAREAGPAPLEAPPTTSGRASPPSSPSRPTPRPFSSVPLGRRDDVGGSSSARWRRPPHSSPPWRSRSPVRSPGTRPRRSQIASASLSAFAAGPPGATGQVSVVEAGGERRIEVSATMPPAPEQGYYEVWLLDERTDSMIAIGALGENGHGTFTMPAGLDMTGYSVVDVSAERYDGDPAHASSVLRGNLSS